MALRPLVKADGKPLRSSSARMGDIRNAVTNYRVLTENGAAALVECTPETGQCCGCINRQTQDKTALY